MPCLDFNPLVPHRILKEPDPCDLPLIDLRADCGSFVKWARKTSGEVSVTLWTGALGLDV